MVQSQRNWYNAKIRQRWILANFNLKSNIDLNMQPNKVIRKCYVKWILNQNLTSFLRYSYGMSMNVLRWLKCYFFFLSTEYVCWTLNLQKIYSKTHHKRLVDMHIFSRKCSKEIKIRFFLNFAHIVFEYNIRLLNLY